MAVHTPPRLLSLPLLATVIALAVTPAPAGAQAFNGAAFSLSRFSKSDAILGGPSALQAILAQQRATPEPATLRTPLPPPHPASASAAPFARAILPITPAVGEGVVTGRPDVFGTVALRVSHTPLDSKWRSVERSNVGPQAARFAAGLRGKSSFERLEAVNWYVNRRVHFVDDSQQFGRADVWSSAADTLRRGRGDCEDYAIAKLQMLRRAGLGERDLYLVIVKDLVRRADHAVLVARAAGHMYVLDNGTDEVMESETISDYRPVLSFSASGEWTHGYRVNPAPVEIAAADPKKPLAPASSPAEPQRSRSASLLAFNIGFNR
jgi:predicted transglutaminase-like cysteine proteinase